MPSKKEYDAVYTCELDLKNPSPSDSVASGSGERSRHSPIEGGEARDDAPWEKRYENLWVEVEKREVKSTFKSVAGELKEKFGELFKSRRSADDVTEDEQAVAEPVSAEEDSSDEEGEVIVRPTARARSTVLVTIPEQRESGPEESLTESADSSVCEERLKVGKPAANERSIQEELDLTSSHSTTAARESTTVVDHNSFTKDETKFGAPQQQMSLNWEETAVGDNNHVCSEDDPGEFAASRPPSTSRFSAPVPGVSDEELEEDMERFKLEVGMLKLVFTDLDKEKTQLQRKVEDGRPS